MDGRAVSSIQAGLQTTVKDPDFRIGRILLTRRLRPSGLVWRLPGHFQRARLCEPTPSRRRELKVEGRQVRPFPVLVHPLNDAHHEKSTNANATHFSPHFSSLPKHPPFLMTKVTTVHPVIIVPWRSLGSCRMSQLLSTIVYDGTHTTWVFFFWGPQTDFESSFAPH